MTRQEVLHTLFERVKLGGQDGLQIKVRLRHTPDKSSILIYLDMLWFESKYLDQLQSVNHR